MLTEEQVKEIKSQILRQIKNWPAEQAEPARQQIEAMNAEQLEEFLKKNQEIQQAKGQGGTGQCIFCSIAQGKTQSFKIDENDKAIAVLEINPSSEGHTIVLPKEHINQDKISEQSQLQELAKKVSETLKLKLSPKSIETSIISFQDHSAINIIPIYEDSSTPKERKQASLDELKKLQEKILSKTEDKEGKSKQKSRIKPAKPKKLPKVPKRTP